MAPATIARRLRQVAPRPSRRTFWPPHSTAEVEQDSDATTLPVRLNETLGATYDFERELGGGGMSRVFVIRWRLHWVTDVTPLRGYPPFQRMLEPQG